MITRKKTSDLQCDENSVDDCDNMKDEILSVKKLNKRILAGISGQMGKSQKFVISGPKVTRDSSG